VKVVADDCGIEATRIREARGVRGMVLDMRG
jgi:hypothetical protein